MSVQKRNLYPGFRLRLKSLYGNTFPVVIGEESSQADLKEILMTIGEQIKEILQDEIGLRKFILSVPDWTVGSPYKIDEGKLNGSNLFFSSDLGNVLKSLVILDDDIWGAKGGANASEVIMTHLNKPFFAALERKENFGIRIKKMPNLQPKIKGFDGDEVTTLSESSDSLTPLLKLLNENLKTNQQQKDGIIFNDLKDSIIKENDSNFFEELRNNFLLSVGQTAKKNLDDRVRSLIEKYNKGLTEDQKKEYFEQYSAMFWAFWKSFLFFYEEKGKLEYPKALWHITIPIYRIRKTVYGNNIEKYVSPLSFIIIIWDDLSKSARKEIYEKVLEEYKLDTPLYFFASQWSLLDNFTIAREALRSQIVKTSIATIMSRNGSHNIGSHVLSSIGTDNIKFSDDRILFKYIQQRMDYIAQITTEDKPSWGVSVSFKNDLMKRFYLQKHLLNNIAKSEGLTAFEHSKRKTYVVGKDQEYIEVDITDPDEQIHKLKIVLKNDNDVLLSIPGGVVGQHAFYTILENFIRNSAKHNWSRRIDESQTNLEIYIEFIDRPSNDFIIFRIWDNIPVISNEYKLDEIINDYLSNSFVSEDGQLSKENWGLAEMKISAGYLNYKSTDQIGQNGAEVLFDEKKYSDSASLIKAIKQDNDKLGYEFAVPKPKELLIVSNVSLDKRILKEAEKESVFIKQEIPENRNYEMIVLNKYLLENDQFDLFEGWKFPHKIMAVGGGAIVENYRNIISLSDFLKETLSNVFENCDTDWKELKLNLQKEWLEQKYLNKSKFEILHLDIDPYTGDSMEGSDKTKLKTFLKFFQEDIFKEYYKKRNVPQEYSTNYRTLKNTFINETAKLIKTLSITDGADVSSQGKFLEHLYQLRDDVFFKISINNLINIFVKIIEKSSVIDEYAAENYKNDFSKALKRVFNEKGDNEDSIETLDEFWNNLIGLQPQFVDEIKQTFSTHLKIINKITQESEGSTATLPLFYDSVGLEENPNQWDPCEILNKITIIDKKDPDQQKIANILFKRHIQFTEDDDILYQEALSGSQYYFPQLTSNVSDYQKSRLVYSLVETALSKILIIDERVARYYNENLHQRCKFDSGGISIICNFEFNFASRRPMRKKIPNPQHQEVFKVIEEGFHKSINFNDQFEYNYIIIHQGIIDKLKARYESNEVKIFLKKLKKNSDMLVITSGRGKPDEIEDDLKYIPFSNIDTYLMKPYPEKFLLIQMLNKIKR